MKAQTTMRLINALAENQMAQDSRDASSLNKANAHSDMIEALEEFANEHNAETLLTEGLMVERHDHEIIIEERGAIMGNEHMQEQVSFFAAQSPRGSANEISFVEFPNRIERDDWVAKHKDDAWAITGSEALELARAGFTSRRRIPDAQERETQCLRNP